MFSITSRFAKLGLKPIGCSSCSVCEKNCPGDAIVVDKRKGAVVDPTHCLVCFECESSCPVDAFSYQSLKKNK
ncbi:MAG: 4Fe-4S dicluster domain-containing protein [Halanaerobiales bacterium]|nr:4Fe-4S dicluster domain-containing protein [Halanaerobiales bacterium]